MAEAATEAWYYVVNGTQAGPVNAQEIPALIAAGTITRETLVWNNRMTSWLAAGQTELAALFGSAPLVVASAAPAGQAPAGDSVAIGQCIKEAWGLMRQNPTAFLLGNIVFMILNYCSLGLLTGLWYAGVAMMVHKSRAGERVEFVDIFEGFERFGPVFGAGLIFHYAVMLGLLFFIVPGLLAGAYLLFLVPLVAVKEMPLTQALKTCGELTKQNLWMYVLSLLVVALLGMSGMILCYVGVLLTAPFVPLAIAVAFENSQANRPESRD